MDAFSQFTTKMESTTDYLKMEQLQNGYCYKIYARNAYVGVWQEKRKAFMISRYKMSEVPRLRQEYHWDTHDDIEFPFGTVKPIELIEKFPFELKEVYNKNEERDILNYLDALEENYPLVQGFNSLLDRKKNAIGFSKRISSQNRLARRLKKLGISMTDYTKCYKAKRTKIEQ